VCVCVIHQQKIRYQFLWRHYCSFSDT